MEYFLLPVPNLHGNKNDRHHRKIHCAFPTGTRSFYFYRLPMPDMSPLFLHKFPVFIFLVPLFFHKISKSSHPAFLSSGAFFFHKISMFLSFGAFFFHKISMFLSFGASFFHKISMFLSFGASFLQAEFSSICGPSALPAIRLQYREPDWLRHKHTQSPYDFFRSASRFPAKMWKK